jgi:hypothetical protein
MNHEYVTCCLSNEVSAADTIVCKFPWLYLLSPCAVYCISHGSCFLMLYLGRGGPQDQDARVRHAHWVCRSHSQKCRYTKNRPIGVTVVFANGTYTPSARDALVRLGLVALPFPSRAPGDKIRGRYSIRRVAPSHILRREHHLSSFLYFFW